MVDMQQLIYGSKAAKGIQGQMEQHRQAFSKEVAQQEDQLQKARTELERQRSVTPPNQLEAKGREYQQKVEALDRNVQGKQQALQQVYSEAMSKVEFDGVAGGGRGGGGASGQHRGPEGRGDIQQGWLRYHRRSHEET